MINAEDVYRFAANRDVVNLSIALKQANNNTEWYRNYEPGIRKFYLVGTTAMHIAAFRGYIDVLRMLLDRGADIDSQTTFGASVLHCAMRGNHHKTFKFLLSRGANIETTDHNAFTALHVAAFKGCMRWIFLLCDKGANLQARDNVGGSPLHIAAKRGKIKCIGVLQERGADIERKDDHGRSPILVASRQGMSASIKVLLDMGADIDSRDLNGRTALLTGARRGKSDSVRVLLDRGAHIDENKIEKLNAVEQQCCKKMILNEIQHRLRRTVFNSYIDHHIEYQPYKRQIYLKCYPTGDLRVAEPPIGWPRAEAIRNKYYFDEILFYVHLYVANEQAKKLPHKRTRASSKRCSNITTYLANNSNETSTLMAVLSDRLKMYLEPI